MAKLSLCPSCLQNSFELLVDFGVVPCSGTFLSGPKQSYRAVPLCFEFCSKCGLIRRKLFVHEEHDYTCVSRATAHRLPGYGAQIVETLRQKGVDDGDLIVDVGANDGTFLRVLAEAGFPNRLGIEPSRACEALCRYNGQPIENVHLDLVEAGRIRSQYGPARAVTCRHTLEHVSDPFNLLSAMRLLLDDDGILFVEVPDSRGITHHLRGHELWDEHLHGFTPENLQLLVRRAGFRVDSTLATSHRNETVSLLWCTAGSAGDERSPLPPVSALDVQLCCRFKGRWASFCEQLLLAQLNWPRPIACLGASHPQSNFLLFTGLGHHVDLLVDDDPAKVGRYVPVPKPVCVVSSDQLLDNQPVGTVVFSAFGYEEWMYRRFAALAETGVQIIVPYNLGRGEPEKRAVS